jgi:hypothetical protein
MDEVLGSEERRGSGFAVRDRTGDRETRFAKDPQVRTNPGSFANREPRIANW